MLNILLRKARSALSLLTTENGLQLARTRLMENLRTLRLACTPGGRLEYRSVHGCSYIVLPEVPETRELYIRWQGYEQTEIAVIRAWLEPEDFAVDCGANVGFIASLCAHLTGPAGLVWAVEASTSTRKKLIAVLDALHLAQVTVVPKAVSDKCGEVVFNNDSSSSEANAILTGPMADAVTDVCRVECVSLEVLLASAATRQPAFIKLDIEGAEPLAFRGWPSLATTSHPPLLLFEVYPRGLARQGFTPADIFAALPLHRYDLWHINSSWPNDWPEFPRGQPFPLPDPFLHPWPMHSNVIAVPKEGGFVGRASKLAAILPA
jgi:FkbM family methyltransferase